MRYQPLTHAVTLSLPSRVSVETGLKFIEQKRGWVLSQLEKRPGGVLFADGAVIPVLGKEYRLVHKEGRGVVTLFPPPLRGRVRVGGESFWLDTNLDDTTPPPIPLPQGEGVILVPGDQQFMARRVREWLKKEARAEIAAIAAAKAERIGRSIKKISLRDTRSLWGSCNHKGNLSFSWRLVFAPRDILDYIVSHEVAHLAELNHSAAFWRIVAELCPHWRESRAWLKKYGEQLFRYGK